MFLLRHSQGISSGCYHATPTTNYFWNCHYYGRGHYASASTYPRYFFRVPPCHPKPIFWGILIIVGRGIMLLLRLSQGNSSGCHHVTPKRKFFWNCHYYGKGALCFCLDLARYLFRVPQCHTYTQNSWCHHAKRTHTLLNCHYCGKGALCFRFDLASVFFQGATMPTLNTQKNFWNCHYCGKGHYASASTWPRYFFRVPLCHPTPKKF